MLSTLGTYLWGEPKTEDFSQQVSFFINGRQYSIDSGTVPVDTSLVSFIRNNAQLRGTKFSCLEGGCGVCCVVIERDDLINKDSVMLAVNSCLMPVFSCHGLRITTIEGIGNRRGGYHPLQKQLAQYNGSQCGFCSPGMVMTMYGLLKSNRGSVSTTTVENAFGGNLCRCTGYRPILDAFKSLARSGKIICQDIEDLGKECSRSSTTCSNNCAIIGVNKTIFLKFLDQREWYKVYKLEDVTSLLEQIGDRSYMLLSGNTAHGVYRRDIDLQVFIDISSIEELHSYQITDVITIGGNISLTEFAEILTKAGGANSSFAYCKELVKHVDMIAHPLVRNIGSIAGNLSIKHAHKDFPSDIYLLLDAVNAQVILIDNYNKSSVMSLQNFLLTNMNKKIIKSIILPSIDPSMHEFKSYKVMPRSQNAHAYVNGAFLVKFANDRASIKSSRICFGGINPELTHATETENTLIGRNLFTNDTVQNTLTTLANELNPDWILPNASAEYRKNVALSLFYKFVLSIAPQDKVASQLKSGGSMLERPLSSGKQSFDTYKKNWPLTKNIPKLEGLVQCAGEAEYINDIPLFPGELCAAYVKATQPHSKIADIDASNALRLPGVVAFYTAKDIPGTNDFSPTSLGYHEIEDIFCSANEEIRFHGQPIGVIVAETFEIAQRAATLVEVTYERISQRKLVPTLQATTDARPADCIFSESHEVTGELYKNTVEIDCKTITGRMELAGQAHFPLENQICLCVPVEDGLDVYSSTQWMDTVQTAIAEMLSISLAKVNVFVRRLGGSFGAKISRATQVACAVALAAHLTNRPVRLHLTLETTMETVGKRYGCFSDYEINHDESGKISKMAVYFTQDYGLSFNEPVGNTTTAFLPNCYDSRSWKIVEKKVKTDAAKNTWCRAPATTEAIATIETIMEHIAHATGKDPLDVRFANMPLDCPFRKQIPDFLEQVQFDQRKKLVDTFNSSNRWKKRGIAVIPHRYMVEYGGSKNAYVTIFKTDGSVAVTHGGIEMGQGINTKVVQVVAHVLNIPMEKVSVKPTTSLTASNATASGGSITSEVICFAAKGACEVLLNRMKPFREKYPKASWEELVRICYVRGVDLSVNFLYRPQDIQPYYIWSLGCVEVEVDLLTGNLLIWRMDIQQDTGESMSPGIDIGQVEGAVVMGLGYYLTEELIFDCSNGKLLTNRTWNYKIPGAKDIPVDFRVNFLPGSSNAAGVLRSKATGEPPLNLSVVVLFALRYALRSVRKDAGLSDDWIPLGSATTPEQIFLKAGNSIQQYLLN